MPRYKLTIAYDGTDFCGWQKQEPYLPDPAAGPLPEQIAVHPGTSAFEAARPIGVREGETRARVALRTVQHVVEDAVREIVREAVILTGASRTDSGVHARGQVAAFTCSGDGVGDDGSIAEEKREEEGVVGGRGREVGGSTEEGKMSARSADVPRGAGWPLSRGTDRLLRALNGRLPEDVQVIAVEPVHGSFNPIQDAVAKAYSYTLHVSPPPPKGQALRALWDRRYVHHVWDELDVAAMHSAAARIVGEHDFAAFAAAGHGRLTTVRTVFSCRVSELVLPEGAADGAGVRRIRIDVSGSGFLYNMVRIIAGTLVEVGRGRMTVEDVARAIESKDRRQAGPTLPPTGLCLEWIKY